MADGGKTRKDLEADIVSDAVKDEAFRKELISNPKATIEKKLQGELPGNLKVTVLEESADQMYLVVPVNEEVPPSGELSDKQLEAVSGGWGDCSQCCGDQCDVDDA